jgi:signal transduction histidine kinase
LASLIDLYQRAEDTEKKEFLMGKLGDVAKRLSNTVQDLSEVVIINQNADVAKNELRFDTVLESIITSLTGQIMETNALVTYDFTACETISYPKVYFESILLNLMTNALKYSSDKRRPEIFFKSTKHENGLITLTCTDNGLGIDMNKYGNKLFSLHKTFHNRPDARGVGLFITKHQIKSLGGNIYVESEPDRGTKFIIKFNEIDVL